MSVDQVGDEALARDFNSCIRGFIDFVHRIEIVSTPRNITSATLWCVLTSRICCPTECTPAAAVVCDAECAPGAVGYTCGPGER